MDEERDNEQEELYQAPVEDETSEQEVLNEKVSKETLEDDSSLTKPYHLDPRFQEVIRQRNELEKERNELAEKLKELETLKEDFYESEEETEDSSSFLKKRIADLENEVYQQKAEFTFRDLLPKFSKISANDEDRTLIKGLMLCNPKLTMEEAMETLQKQREARDKKVVNDYLTSKKAVKGIGLGTTNVASLMQQKEPETLEEAKEIAKKLLGEVI